MIARLVTWLIDKAKRTPYFHLYHADESLYMERYWLVPFADASQPGCYIAKWYHNPLVWLLQRFGIAARVHYIATPDLDRVMHDHPWNFLSIVLRGWYSEFRPLYPERFVESNYAPGMEMVQVKLRDAGSIAFRRATDRHRIADMPIDGVWTLFITFKYQNGWGFYTPAGKVPWREYLNRTTGG